MKAVVQVENVSKRFTLHHERPRSFKELVINLFGRNGRAREEFWALRDISFALDEGQALGIIGSNGAGKSTVLKLIARILEPTAGRIRVNGRVSALLELGAGFHPDLTGRENIYLNGSLLGLSKKEMARVFDDIVAFSDLERFIDMPVKHYSSGMYMRLGFAIAINVQPDILLIDEVLAVGDQAFQRKCLDQIKEFKQRGIPVIFVSHNLEMVARLCTRAIWLDDGLIASSGRVDSVIEAYLNAIVQEREAQLRAQHGRAEPRSERSSHGSHEIEIVEVRFLDGDGKERFVFETGEKMVARIKYQAHIEVENPVFGLAIYRDDNLRINGPNTSLSDYKVGWVRGEGQIDYIIEELPLLAGTYQFTVAIYDPSISYSYDYHSQMYTFSVRQRAVKEEHGLCYIPCRWEHSRTMR
jgi:lipopolysaccharide transport system ATP-binding protein